MSNGQGNDYRHNHYVPEWYQRRFLLPNQTAYHYLDLKPDVITNSSVTFTKKDLHIWGPRKCFAQDDLYTVNWGSIRNRDIERFFFGRLDTEAPSAVEYFASYKRFSVHGEAFHTLMRYMSTQKLRTPKGLGYLRTLSSVKDQNLTLILLQRIQDMYVAIWSECIWQIADASQSPTKFIISDHPVIAYNRACYPMSDWCNGFNDPEVTRVATHTYFPLSIDKLLILTNLSWVRDPYQSETNVRPNPNLFRPAMFNFQDIQMNRVLTEEEVVEINFVTKQRALHYIAAAEKDWLYPERHLRDDHWRKLGDGYLFMPDPRHIYMGGETFIGYKDGTSEGFGAYGHRPGQPGYQDQQREERERNALERFKAEWSVTHGTKYRATSGQFYHPGDKIRSDESADMHKHYIDHDEKYRNREGERQRRRSLRRKKPESA